eukprot:3446502-Lingulodinium_polyedra.AAC.1
MSMLMLKLILAIPECCRNLRRVPRPTTSAPGYFVGFSVGLPGRRYKHLQRTHVVVLVVSLHLLIVLVDVGGAGAGAGAGAGVGVGVG